MKPSGYARVATSQIHFLPDITPRHDERLTELYMGAISGNVPVYFAAVPLAICVPFDLDYRPDLHAVGAQAGDGRTVAERRVRPVVRLSAGHVVYRIRRLHSAVCRADWAARLCPVLGSGQTRQRSTSRCSRPRRSRGGSTAARNSLNGAPVSGIRHSGPALFRAPR